jgi:prevent-host-death family protein
MTPPGGLRRDVSVASTSTTLGCVATVPHTEFRNNVTDMVRRAEAGEEITITVAGRPVAQLGPTTHRRWVSGTALLAVWRTPAPQTLDADLEQFPGTLADPLE